MNRQPTTEIRLALHLAWLVLAASMLLWSGRLHSSDGFAMYAVDDSLVRYGRYDIEQLHWMDIQQGTYGRDGLLYSRKGIGTSVAGLPLTVLGFVLPGLGPVQTTLLLSPLLTALGALLLYLTARRAFHHMPRRAAWLVTVAWALGSVAWPYTKTFFSEPLVALATIGAFERLLALRTTPHSRRAAFGIGAWVGLGIVARSAHAIVAPFFAIAALLITWPREISPREALQRWRALPWGVWLSAMWPLLVSLVVVLGYNWARFGHPFESGYLDFETFSANWLVGISGQLISPGRGLLWYVPWLVLLPLGIRAAWRRAPYGTFVALGTFLTYVLLYGKWYMWSGGSAWGPRFLVPTVPLLAWLATPIAARRPRLFGLFLVLGIGVNTVGMLWDFDIHEAWLADLGFEPYALPTFFQVRYAQIPNMVRLGLHAPLDVAWMPTTQVHFPTLLAALTVAGLAFATAVATLTRPWRSIAGGGMLVILATWGLLWQAHVAQSPTYAAVANTIEQMPASRLRIWQDGPPGTERFLNHYRGRAPILGTNVASGELPTLEATRVFDQVEDSRALWIVSDGPSRLANALDQVASTRKAFVDEIVFDDVRATFYFDSTTWQAAQADIPLALDGVPILHLRSIAFTPTPDLGIAGVRLTWQVLHAPGEPVQTFVHIFDAQGEKVAQRDSAAQNGWRSAETWQVGEVITDTLAMRVDSLPPGTYSLVVGFYRLRDISPLTTPDGAGSLTVGTLTITP